MVNSTGESGGMSWLSLMVDCGQVPPGNLKLLCFLEHMYYNTLGYIELYIHGNMECVV